MAKKMVVNTDKFIKWLEENISAEYADEAKASSKSDYLRAIESKATRDTYEFILRAVKCDPDDDPAEFMEEVDDEQ